MSKNVKLCSILCMIGVNYHHLKRCELFYSCVTCTTLLNIPVHYVSEYNSSAQDSVYLHYPIGFYPHPSVFLSESMAGAYLCPCNHNMQLIGEPSITSSTPNNKTQTTLDMLDTLFFIWIVRFVYYDSWSKQGFFLSWCKMTHFTLWLTLTKTDFHQRNLDMNLTIWGWNIGCIVSR